MMNGPLGDLRAAVARKDAASFSGAYDKLTEACNACSRRDELRIQPRAAPASNPYPSQAGVMKSPSEKALCIGIGSQVPCGLSCE